MSLIEQTYYIAIRQKDVHFMVAGSIKRKCNHCGDVVVIDPLFIQTADSARGILCAPCIMEHTGKTILELAEINMEDMIDILKERFG